MAVLIQSSTRPSLQQVLDSFTDSEKQFHEASGQFWTFSKTTTNFDLICQKFEELLAVENKSISKYGTPNYDHYLVPYFLLHFAPQINQDGLPKRWFSNKIVFKGAEGYLGEYLVHYMFVNHFNQFHGYFTKIGVLTINQDAWKNYYNFTK